MSKSPKASILFSVTNDLSYDQRMDRICTALSEHGFACTLIGRKTSSSRPLVNRNYATKRIALWFQKGKLFYLEYNFRLFWKALFSSYDVYCAIDLDTYLPMYLVARLRAKKIVYDAHEYFSELEEVVKRPFVHFAWQKVEAFAIKSADAHYTISDGYALLFKERYNADFRVIRNVPWQSEIEHSSDEREPYIIYQGALNIGRGLEASVRAMHAIEGLKLKIYGEGPIQKEVELLIAREKLGHKVELMGALLPHDLKRATANAFVGLTLFSEIGLHHQHSLANRFFDYLHAGIPQIAMNYSEYKHFNDRYHIAYLIDALDSAAIAQGIKALQDNQSLVDELKSNCQRAANENNWQIESQQLIKIYSNL